MKSTKYQLLQGDFDSAIRDLKMYREIIDQLRKENQELVSLNLWSARRLDKNRKQFAYDELDRITKQKHERL